LRDSEESWDVEEDTCERALEAEEDEDIVAIAVGVYGKDYNKSHTCHVAS
jgi:hypothetical protein